MEKVFMTTKQVAERYGVSDTAVKKWTRNNGLRVTKCKGNFIFEERDVEKFIAKFWETRNDNQ